MLSLVLMAALADAPPPPDLAAVGVIVSPRPERSVALLRSGGRTRIVGVGETGFGGRVVVITGEGVLLDFSERLVTLRLSAGGHAVASARPPVAAPPAAASSEAPEDPTTPARAMERREVERRLGQEAPRILAETTLIPVTEAGQVAGFTLTRVPEGSLLTDAGLRAGDILTRVNDVPIDSLATLIALWPRLQGESVLRAVVLRQGRPVSLTVTLR